MSIPFFNSFCCQIKAIFSKNESLKLRLFKKTNLDKNTLSC